MCQDQSARMIIKRGSGVPTIPVSADHRNGDWIATDIYEGEFYQDTDTGLTYQRNGSTIVTASGKIVQDTYKAVVSQTSTGDPVIEQELQNTLGLTVTTSYVLTGSYGLAGLAGNAAREVEVTLSGLAATDSFDANPTSANTISLRTYSSGVLADDVLLYQGVTYPRRYCILTINFY